MERSNKNGEDISAKWQRYLTAASFSTGALADCAAGKCASDRGGIAGRVKELRDLRRDFMKACGEQDDAYMAPAEAELIRLVEALSAKAVKACGLKEWEIDAAEPPSL